MAAVGLLGVLFLVGCESSISHEEYLEALSKAKACDPGDSCVLIEAACGCCTVPVNASEADRIDDLTNQVDCDETCSCQSDDYAVCEDGVCVGYRNDE